MKARALREWRMSSPHGRLYDYSEYWTRDTMASGLRKYGKYSHRKTVPLIPGSSYLIEDKGHYPSVWLHMMMEVKSEIQGSGDEVGADDQPTAV